MNVYWIHWFWYRCSNLIQKTFWWNVQPHKNYTCVYIKWNYSHATYLKYFDNVCNSFNVHNAAQDSRFKIALLLPIKHRIIYITVKSTWNVNTSTNTAMHYHGSKGSWKSCRIYGLLVCYTYSKYISTGVQRVQQKKKTQNDITSNYVSTTHAVHDFNTVQLK